MAQSQEALEKEWLRSSLQDKRTFTLRSIILLLHLRT